MSQIVELFITEQNATFIGWLWIISMVVFWGYWVFASIKLLGSKKSKRSEKIQGFCMLSFAIILVWVVFFKA